MRHRHLASRCSLHPSVEACVPCATGPFGVLPAPVPSGHLSTSLTGLRIVAEAEEHLLRTAKHANCTARELREAATGLASKLRPFSMVFGLNEFCGANNADFDSVLKDVRERRRQRRLGEDLPQPEGDEAGGAKGVVGGALLRPMTSAGRDTEEVVRPRCGLELDVPGL